MSINARRRKILLTSISILLPAAAAATAQTNCASTATAATNPEVDETLFAAAIDFIKRRYIQHDRPIVYGPVSRLQREFSLGFRAGRELVSALETANVWKISIKLETQIATVNLESPHLQC